MLSFLPAQKGVRLSLPSQVPVSVCFFHGLEVPKLGMSYRGKTQSCEACNIAATRPSFPADCAECCCRSVAANLCFFQ